MRATLTVTDVKEHKIKDEVVSERLTMEAVYSADNPEDQSYAAATPYAKLEMQIDNSILIGQYPVGTKFAVSFHVINK